jgi:hypothetical protein
MLFAQKQSCSSLMRCAQPQHLYREPEWSNVAGAILDLGIVCALTLHGYHISGRPIVDTDRD